MSRVRVRVAHVCVLETIFQETKKLRTDPLILHLIQSDRNDDDGGRCVHACAWACGCVCPARRKEKRRAEERREVARGDKTWEWRARERERWMERKREGGIVRPLCVVCFSSPWLDKGRRSSPRQHRPRLSPIGLEVVYYPPHTHSHTQIRPAEMDSSTMASVPVFERPTPSPSAYFSSRPTTHPLSLLLLWSGVCITRMGADCAIRSRFIMLGANAWVLIGGAGEDPL